MAPPSQACPQVRNVLRGTRIQPKLRVGAPDDPAEREADQIADRVMRMPEPSVHPRPAPAGIQRMCAECEEEVQRQPVEEEEELLQAKEEAGRTPAVTPGVATDIASLRGRGQPLPASERAFFEPRFGRDFGHVRVHTDTRATESARAIHARGFTVGRDVVFDGGEYAPDTAAGKQLLAHELTHVIQQSFGKSGGLIQRQPSVIGWSFSASSGDKLASDNCAPNRYETLGPNSRFYEFRAGMYPSLQNSITNGMQLKAFVGGHVVGASYDVKRVIERNVWQRDNITDPWAPVAGEHKPAGTPDDPDNKDECLQPIPQPYLGSGGVAIYSTDHPGLNPDTLSPTAVQGVYKASFTESVEITDPNGPIVAPIKYDWHSITWVDKDPATGKWVFNAAHSQIGRGAIKVEPPPP